MKKIIKGAQYNTDTAREIGRHGEKVLYKTKAGKYFLHGQGSEHIKPLTVQSAEEWAKEHLTVSDCTKEFGAPDDADGREPLRVYIPHGVRAKLDRMRSETGKSISQIISDAFQ